MKKMEFDSSTPLFLQVYDSLCHSIESGEYSPGGRIPPEDTLCEIFHVSRVTIRAALKKMVEDEILIKKHGVGTFVATHAFWERARAGGSFTRSCQMRGVVPTTKVISIDTKKASLIVRKFLKLSKETEVFCVKRVRMVDGVPAIFEIDYFSEKHKYILDMDVENVPMREIIQKNTGLAIARRVDTFDVRFADKMQSEWLECPPNTALLCVQQLVYAEHNQVIYFNEQYIRSDIYKYVSEQ